VSLESIEREPATASWWRGSPRAWLLLLIGESPAHGYDLLERLGELGAAPIDAGSLYRTLRAMEREGLVESRWEISNTGPARRVYELAPAGRAALGACAEQLADSRRLLGAYLERYAALAAPGGRRVPTRG
jgi:PadR family transcriptional regulator, regulatory protein PadR